MICKYKKYMPWLILFFISLILNIIMIIFIASYKDISKIAPCDETYDESIKKCYIEED